ncbi:biotin synthase [Helicobacter sp. 11S02629-2]|uniref:biotin synthase n=1 Tax=Helicobacter sp. 11S02629-2 TaxID=1476195 RepID=UPI000BA6798F|nr:biotin synthase [Helicobacter sp. 11S02629-2]PAF43114.1 biotin synthase BioB [Helicobacter sp. 11S02629-2]
MSIFLCSISNVSSGNCPEDCAYCTQSVHHKTKVETYKFKPLETIIKEAKYLKTFGMLGFCLVTSGRSLDDAKLDYIARVSYALKKEDLDLHLIACCGSASLESLKYLKDHGVDSYNHNLETAQSFFPRICSTHTWEERYQTCEDSLRAGLGLCCGGIYGLGESFSQRIEFLKALRELSPHTISLNFYMPNPALPIATKVMSRQEALECVVLTHEFLPNSRLMISGGRESVFGEDQEELFRYGVNAIVLGNYLTTKGQTPARDIDMLKAYGLDIAASCHAM